MLLFFIYVYNFRNPISNVHSTIGKRNKKLYRIYIGKALSSKDNFC